MHIQNINKAGELSEESTIKLDLKVQKEGSRTVKRAIKLEVYQFICPETKEANKCALKKYTLEQRTEMVRAACFSMVFAHNFSGLIARSWSTEAQGNIPAFSFYGTEREEDVGVFVDEGGVLGRPIPILPYTSSLSCSMTNPWISKLRSTVFPDSSPNAVTQDMRCIVIRLSDVRPNMLKSSRRSGTNSSAPSINSP